MAHYSHKPAARAFRDFVNGTVAEAIEKDGAYVHPALAQQNPDFTVRPATSAAASWEIFVIVTLVVPNEWVGCRRGAGEKPPG